VMRTRLFVVNDQRLALGAYVQLGGTTHPFIYDLVYKKYTLLSVMNPGWTSVADLNNHGQITGTAINDNGATRKGFVFDCQNGQFTVDVPTSTWTVPYRIDDEGNVYGRFTSPEMVETYFVARPEAPTTDIDCSLVGRDDTFEPLAFVNGPSFEMSGDFALATSIADFSGDGTTDILVDHGEGKVILYLGEEGFESKIKYAGESFATIFDNEFPDVDVPEITSDVNNDGFEDEIIVNSSSIEFSLGKADGSFHYVSQIVSGTKLADLDNDGLLDIITVSGGYISIRYQDSAAATAPAPEPEPTPAPAPEPAPEPAPSDPSDDLYLFLLSWEFPGSELLKLGVDEETGEAEFKVLYQGEKIEGLIGSDFEIAEINL
jgi:hypothetical protein